MWCCVSAIGDAHTPAPSANANTTGHRYFCPPSVAARALLRWLLLSALDLALLTTTPNSNNGSQGFYTTQELATDFLKDPDPTVPRIPTVHRPPAWPKRRIKRSGKAGDNWVISHSGRFRTFMPLEDQHSYPRAGSNVSSQWRKSNAPPILKDEDDMMDPRGRSLGRYPCHPEAEVRPAA